MAIRFIRFKEYLAEIGKHENLASLIPCVAMLLMPAVGSTVTATAGAVATGTGAAGAPPTNTAPATPTAETMLVIQPELGGDHRRIIAVDGFYPAEERPEDADKKGVREIYARNLATRRVSYFPTKPDNIALRQFAQDSAYGAGSRNIGGMRLGILCVDHGEYGTFVGQCIMAARFLP